MQIMNHSTVLLNNYPSSMKALKQEHSVVIRIERTDPVLAAPTWVKITKASFTLAPFFLQRGYDEPKTFWLSGKAFRHYVRPVLQ